MCLTLGIQRSKRMRCVILRFETCMALPYFSHLLINGTIFGKKVVEHKMCVLIFYCLCLKRFYCKKNSVRCHKCQNILMYSTRYSC